LSIFIGLLALLYPLIAYLGLTVGSPSMVAGGLIIVVLLRLKFGHSTLFNKNQIKLFALSMFIVLGYSLLTDTSDGIRFYPVAMSLLFLFIFAQSLWSKQTLIERIARINEPNLPASAVSYTRKVTIVWCMFFFINAGIAAYTALFSTMETWTFYNGLLSYCIMGLVGSIEWLVRKRYKYKQTAQ
jgi:uncharacterized membrane protein